jgi:hypothetical protein
MEKCWAWWCMPVISTTVGSLKNRKIMAKASLGKK